MDAADRGAVRGGPRVLWRPNADAPSAGETSGRRQPRSGRKSARSRPRPSPSAGEWGYTHTADWRVDAEFHEVKEHSAGVLERQWRESSGRLGEYLKGSPDPLGDLRQRRARQPRGAGRTRPLEARGHRHRPDVERGQPSRGSGAEQERSTGMGSLCSAVCRPRGTCSNLPLARLWPRPGPPAWA